MLKLIRWFYSTSLLHRLTLKSHFDWTWQLSLFLRISHTGRLFVSFSIHYASLAWMVREQYCQSPENNGNSSTNRRKWVNLSIHSFISYCLARSLSLNLFVLLLSTPLFICLSRSVSVQSDVKLILENWKQIRGCNLHFSWAGLFWIKSTLW